MAEFLIEDALSEEFDFLTKEQANLVWNRIETLIVEKTKQRHEEGKPLVLRGMGSFYILKEGGRPSRNEDGSIKLDDDDNVVLTDTYDTMRFRSGSVTLDMLNPEPDTPEDI